MQHYKTPDNKIYAIEPEFEHMLPENCTPITDEEATAICKAELLPPNPRFTGIEFEGVMCSATKDDQNGLMAVLLATQMQGAAFKPTRYDFSNGNTLVLTKENIAAFAAVWMPFRQGFFTVDV